jgi:hypothetical protein
MLSLGRWARHQNSHRKHARRGSLLHALMLKIQCRLHDKGKPAARRGRKAQGPLPRREVAGLPKGGFLIYWIALGLAGSSLIASITTLYLMLDVRQSAFRAEQAGDERLEMLREQQQRLEFMREERRMLEEELEWRRSMMNGEGRPLELEAPTESNGHPERNQPKPLFRLRRLFEW